MTTGRQRAHSPDRSLRFFARTGPPRHGPRRHECGGYQPFREPASSAARAPRGERGRESKRRHARSDAGQAERDRECAGFGLSVKRYPIPFIRRSGESPRPVLNGTEHRRNVWIGRGLDARWDVRVWVRMVDVCLSLPSLVAADNSSYLAPSPALVAGVWSRKRSQEDGNCVPTSCGPRRQQTPAMNAGEGHYEG